LTAFGSKWGWQGSETSFIPQYVMVKKPYEVIDFGSFTPDKHIWEAPYLSDWVIAIGKFDSK
jgi:hypothetical protein